MTPPTNRRPGGPQGAPRGKGPRKPPRPGRRNQPERGTTGRSRQGQPDLAPEPPQAPTIDVHDPEGTRLQKVLAAAGIGSRRACELLIQEGRVEVDGQVVTELGLRVDPLRQTVHVDGERVHLDESRVYLAFNKPVGVVTTMSDELGRLSIGDYVAGRPERLFHVGRLDADTEGLLILTNDGDLAHRLQHPAHGVLKTYIAEIPGPVPKDLGKRLREGVQLEDGPVAVDSFRVVDSRPGKAIVEVILHEGRKHIVRRMLEHVGHPVLSLVRTQVGPITLGTTKSGRWRALSRAEIADLYKAAGL
ncbi:pseudouridine synthase [Janibacter terrae]|uniref:pseudouridine synthase n=1 Tax=Janibacter terrae TaxID=103817 RepID=UPI00083936AB|nr:pseudouridine synthase [Janibacter terrae]MBA4085149.1 rRNA pseudouridine synthase [Kytococcus sp.]HBO55020.1 rRNA pseudouridine synthase [Janibacter terrae]HCA88470.1 rRNA pseudouridine synthase [Streptomyces sp.]